MIGCDKYCYFIMDDQEEQTKDDGLMRVVMGAHHDDIVCVKYSAELSLICTGTSSGELAVWDYEFSRLLDFLIGHTGEITSI